MLTFIAVCQPLPAADPALTKDQRTRAIQLLEDSRKEFLAAVQSVTDEQWNFKPAPDRWSVGQVAEHIMLSESLLFGRVEEAIAAKPNPDWEAKTSRKTTLLERGLLNRDYKAQAPEAIVPQGKFTRAQVIGLYQAGRKTTIEFIQKTQLPLNQYTAEHPFPVFNTLNAYQWILYIPLHNMRHDQQIAEVKATAGYPK